MTTNRIARLALIALAAFSLACAVSSCNEEEDDVGGGSCDDEWDLIVKGEVLSFQGSDEAFTANLDVRADDAAEGEVKLAGSWYDIADGMANSDEIQLLLLEADSEYQQGCDDPTAAGGVFYLFLLESDNGLAGPFDGDLEIYCGPSWPSGERLGTWNVESDVTCEDL